MKKMKFLVVNLILFFTASMNAQNSNNANLASVIMDGNPWFEVTFEGEQTSVYKEVSFTNDFLCANPYPENSNAEVNGDVGCKNLQEGENIFTLIVTAEDGITKKTYTIVINREPVPERIETVNVSEAGTLCNYLGNDLWERPITKLTITGNIDARDILECLEYNSLYLAELDLSEANIVEYDGYIFYPANELPDYSFTRGSGTGNMLNLNSITLPKTLKSIGNNVLSYNGALTSIEIPEGVTSIGSNFASSQTELTTVILPSTLTSLGDYSFRDCYSLSTIINKNSAPFETNGCFIYGLIYTSAPIFVPFGSGAAYRDVWNWTLLNIVELPDISEEDIAVIPSNNNALIEWQSYEYAEGYKLIIYSDEALTDTLYMFEFDATGELLRSASTNLSHTIENLQSGTDYFYTLEILGISGVVLASQSGKFTTSETTSIDVSLAKPAETAIVGYYSVLGEKLPQEPKKGLYIILYSNGKTEKIIKK